MDGYFYVSGDTYRNPDGSIASSALVALQSDILLNGALPAGYTYLYVPWPRPHYPSDTGYFYNVNSLLHDRLYYAKHCKEYYSDKQYNAIDLDKPASYTLYNDEQYFDDNKDYEIYYNLNKSDKNYFQNMDAMIVGEIVDCESPN